jgi:hypothetical protein
MSQHIAIVSYFSTGAYDANTSDVDQIFSSILIQEGISHEIVAWSDPLVVWSRFTTLLIKSTWDYFDYYPAFLNWIAEIQQLQIPVLNSLETILWNSSKRYLLEIEQKGYPVIAGMILEKGKPVNMTQIQEKIKSEIWVVKPLVSGGAKNTLKIPVLEWEKFAPQVRALVEEEDFLVQPFVPEVAEVGEYSLMFFNQVVSHAVLKTPAKEDFRVQHYFGGTIQKIEPSSKMLESCQALVQKFAPDSLYARVDGVEIDGVFHLMELELIEPYLFLGLADQAIPNYRTALMQRLS